MTPYLCPKCNMWQGDHHYHFRMPDCCRAADVPLEGRDVLLSLVGVHPLAVRHGLRGRVVERRGSVLIILIDGSEFQFTRDEVRLTCLDRLRV